MTYDEAMEYWFRRVDFERKTPLSSDLKLRNIALLLRRLGDPQSRFRIVHVAGSKGKGSTAAMLSSILRENGFRVGLFTSPHLVNVRERIQVDGEPIAADEAVARLREIREAARAPIPGETGSLNDALTFFEIATALGFLHFSRRRVDWAVVEVGLGGRFDSTNIVEPRAAVITSISLDHTETLGPTTARIAFEKAGIVKPGRPTISGVVDPDAREVIENRCRERGSTLRSLGRDFTYRHVPASVDGGERPARASVSTWRAEWPEMALALVGEHQAANAAVAVATVECLREQGVPISTDAVARGLASVVWPARLEVVRRRPLVVLDCAHNVASAIALRDSLRTSFARGRRRWLVFGGSRDKDLEGMLAVLVPDFDDVVFTRVTNPRAAEPAQLRSLMPAASACRATEIADPAQALDFVREHLQPDDLACVAGSVFLAGELRPRLLEWRPGSAMTNDEIRMTKE